MYIGGNEEKINITNAAIAKVINGYCGHEAGVRNLRKCLDRVFRKIVAKIEDKKIQEQEAAAVKMKPEEELSHANDHHESAVPDTTSNLISSTPTIYKEEHPENVVKEYQVNTKNLEKFLDVPSTDDYYYTNINKQLPIGCANGLAYVDEGYGSVLKIQFVIKQYSSLLKILEEEEEKKDKKDTS